MPTAVRSSHLALICLAFLLTGATTGERLLVHSRTNATTTTTFPPHAPILLLASDAGRPTSSHHHLRASSPSPSTLTGVSPPRSLDVPVIEREDTATAPATTAPTTPPAPPCPGVSAVHAHEPAVDDGTLQAPRGTTTAPSKVAALLNALPLLAIPFLPPPVAVLVALSSLATPVRACSAPSASCSGLTHGRCTVYRYHHDNGTVDRAQPFYRLRAVCPHPRCDAGTDTRALSTAYGRCRGRLDDPLHGYCSVRTLEAEVLPEGKAWRIMPVHLPVADPAAVVAAGGDVCYVELEHMNYREGYYIRCPVRDCRHVPVLCCTEFPHDAIAAAVWEHRRLTYRNTVGWHTNDTARTQLQGP
uniref:Wall-associated receptor kinase galacturonan-binding domain-containing protein n=1 Tax=Setaria italica TaxID=4555 RepID=K3YLK6_SETIT